MSSVLTQAILAQYRTTDPIDNLLLRLSYRRRAAGVAVGDGMRDERDLPAERRGELEETTREFHWQQKEFGPGELLKYNALLKLKDAGGLNPSQLTPLKLEYMEAIRKRGEEVFIVPKNGLIVYTITDRDVHQPREVRENASSPRGSFFRGQQHALLRPPLPDPLYARTTHRAPSHAHPTTTPSSSLRRTLCPPFFLGTWMPVGRQQEEEEEEKEELRWAQGQGAPPRQFPPPPSSPRCARV